MVLLVKDLHPALSAAAVESLRNCGGGGIATVADFLAAEPERVCAHLGVSQSVVMDVRRVLFAKFAPHCSSGLEDVLQKEENRLVLKCGVARLDGILEGGFLAGRVYELYGQPGTGKTQFALTLVSQCIIRSSSGQKQSNVVYFDTKNDFFVQRLLEITEEANYAHATKDTLDKVRVRKAFALSDLMDGLRFLLGKLENLSGRLDPFWFRVRLIVIDNVASLVLPDLGEEERLRPVSAKVAEVVQMLHKLASEQNMTVLVVNNSTSKRGNASGQVPSLGKIFSHTADVRINVRKEGLDNSSSNRRTVKVDKNPHCRLDEPEKMGSSCEIEISKSGWKDARSREL